MCNAMTEYANCVCLNYITHMHMQMYMYVRLVHVHAPHKHVHIIDVS